MGKILGVVAVSGILLGLGFLGSALGSIFIIGGSIFLLTLACILDELIQARRAILDLRNILRGMSTFSQSHYESAKKSNN